MYLFNAYDYIVGMHQEFYIFQWRTEKEGWIEMKASASLIDVVIWYDWSLCHAPTLL